jgi:hypothetical protein
LAGGSGITGKEIHVARKGDAAFKRIAVRNDLGDLNTDDI